MKHHEEVTDIQLKNLARREPAQCQVIAIIVLKGRISQVGYLLESIKKSITVVVLRTIELMHGFKMLC
jgi:hypothetical protein